MTFVCFCAFSNCNDVKIYIHGAVVEKLLDLLEKGSEATTVERSTAAATALCQMAPVSSEHRKRAFSHLLALLVSDIVLVILPLLPLLNC